MINTRDAVQVRVERSGQTSLGGDACLCSMPPTALSPMRLVVGDQVRIEVTGKEECAVYSVIETHATEVSDDIVRMNSSGMKRVGAATDIAGESPANFINWLTARGAGGVQIEQPPDGREEHHQQIAGAVAAVFAARL